MLIGFSGLSGSGKDTIADLLVRNNGFIKVAFADPLKRIVKDIHAFSDDQLWGPSHMRNKPDERYPRNHGPWVNGKCACCDTPKQKGVELTACYLTPRFCLQRLGTEYGRDCYADVWVDLALRTANTLLGENGSAFQYDAKHGLRPKLDVRHDGTEGVAITDVRFLNEIHALKKAGARLIRVVRPGAGLSGSVGAHSSELEQASIPDDHFDAVIHNDGTLEDLLDSTKSLYQTLRGITGYRRIVTSATELLDREGLNPFDLVSWGGLLALLNEVKASKRSDEWLTSLRQAAKRKADHLDRLNQVTSHNDALTQL